MNCDNCTIRKAEPVPFVVHESAMARQERTIKRLWIIILVLVVMFAASWVGFFWYESQFETTETWQDVWQEADGNGSNQFVGGDYNGWPESEDADPDQNS